MDICKQLEAKYPKTFEKLIARYQSIESTSREKRQLKNLISRLLSQEHYGKIILSYIQGRSDKELADFHNTNPQTIKNIINKYSRFVPERNITSSLENNSNICNDLNKKYPSVFDKLIQKFNHSSSDEKKELEKLIKNLLKDDCWYGEAIQIHLKGHTLAEIGRRLNLSRERIRQVIEKYKRYYHEVGSKDWCEIQLRTLLNSYPETNVLPSNAEIKNFHRKLLSAMKEHFIGKKGSTLPESERLEIVKALNLDIIAEIKTHKKWSEERVVYEVQEFAKRIGKPDLMPMQLELAANGRNDLRGVIGRFGGQSKVAQLAGLKYQGQTVAPDGSRTYWTEERIKAFLFEVAEKEGHPGWMPTQAACIKHAPKKSASIITTFTRSSMLKELTLSWVEVANKYGLKYDIECHRITLSYIRSFVKSLEDTLHNLTPAEIYVLFEQQGINKARNYNNRTFDKLVQAIQSGNLPREEIDD